MSYNLSYSIGIKIFYRMVPNSFWIALEQKNFLRFCRKRSKSGGPIVDVKFDDFFQYVETSYKLRRYKFVLRRKHIPKHATYRYFFSYRIILVWNLLPESIASFSTLAAFKTSLKKFDWRNICHLTI